MFVCREREREMSSEDEGCKAAVTFIERTGGVGEMVGAEYNVEDSFSKLIGGVVRVISMEKGKISCILNVKPYVLSGHGVLLGAVVEAVAERVAIACAKTIFGQHSHFYVGQITVSYLSPAKPNVEVVVDASVIRSRREATVVAFDFLLKESERLAYVTRTTLYKTPLSNF